MTNPNKQTIIDVQRGNIIDQYSNDKAILVGVYLSKESNYAENIELVLNPENSEPITVKVPYSGYDMQLFVGDFTGNKKSEIMVRGGFGGTGGFEIGVIYKYEDNKLIEIFNQDIFYKNNNCSAKYKDNYKVSVKCSKKKYLIDISSKSKAYLNEIYSPDGKVKNISQPYVDAPSGIYPLKQVYNDYYDIIINQRIVGTANSDTIAVVQTLANLVDSKFSTIYKGVLLPSYYYNKRKK
ncbi:MAG: hypothetical protein ACRDA3_06950 [Peptostreptococcaceae bacterium]